MTRRALNPQYNCKIYHDNLTSECCILMDKDFRSLRDIAGELNVPYQFIADVSSRKNKKMYQEFKFYPNIEIIKLSKLNNII